MNLKKLILAVCALLWLPLFGAPRVLWPQEASANVRWRLEGGAGTRDGCMKFENAKPDGYSSATLWFPARPGELYTFRAKIKGENIGEKQHPMHGVVFSLFTREGGKWNPLGKPVPLKGCPVHGADSGLSAGQFGKSDCRTALRVRNSLGEGCFS